MLTNNINKTTQFGIHQNNVQVVFPLGYLLDGKELAKLFFFDPLLMPCGICMTIAAGLQTSPTRSLSLFNL
jgi:hypothetical protein